MFHHISILFYIVIWSGFNIGTVECYNGTICTMERCKIEDSSLRFFHIADWGGQPTPPYVTVAQQTIAAVMNNMGEKKKVHFTVSAGDQFYVTGVKNIDDTRFKNTFDDVFTYGRANHVPWFPVAGNHDYYGNVSAQVAYSKRNPRWVYPDLSYLVHYQLMPNGTTVDMIMLDTVIVCGPTWHGGKDPKTGMKKKYTDIPQGPEDNWTANALWIWLEQQLSKSKADYLFVVGHYPVFAAGAHGDATCPGRRMQELLEKYNVTAYLTGHDHNLEYIKSVTHRGWEVHHILSGAGCELDPRRQTVFKSNGFNASCDFFYPEKNVNQARNANRVGGFVYVELKAEYGLVWFYNGWEQALYQVQLRPRLSNYDKETVGGRKMTNKDGPLLPL